MTKTLNQIFFFLHQNQNIFSATLGIRIFFRQKHTLTKQKTLYNQPKPFFYFFFIMKSFLDRFEQMLHQNIRNCQYFDCLFTHYVVMSDFYL
jgi:hypothetical protein